MYPYTHITPTMHTHACVHTPLHAHASVHVCTWLRDTILAPRYGLELGKSRTARSHARRPLCHPHAFRFARAASRRCCTSKSHGGVLTVNEMFLEAVSKVRTTEESQRSIMLEGPRKRMLVGSMGSAHGINTATLKLPATLKNCKLP